MTTPNPITPPPELVQQWDVEGRHQDYCTVASHIATRAAQWGWDQREPEIQAAADQELEACCGALDGINPGKYWSQRLRASRRPKPPSLKEQALDALGPEPLPETGPTGDTILNKGSIERHRTIRLALEALND